MTMPTNNEELRSWVGKPVVGEADEKLGKVFDIYLDDQTHRPEWLAVTSGLFGTRMSFVPLASASADEEEVRVPYAKEQVKGAPTVEANGALTQEEEAALYRHYGLEYSERSSDSGLPEGGASGGSDEAMTRSEEELRVAKVNREQGRARLRKWVDVERVETTVPVTREEARVVREPIHEGNLDEAMRGPEISEAEHEVVLHEEQVVAETQAVPKERVRLEKQAVTDEQQVEAELRKERVGVEDDRPRRG